MTPLFALLQATSVEPLPEEAAASVSELAADPNVAAGAAAAGNHLDIVQLLLHASIPVQFVMLLLLVASIASWVIIFRKRSLLNRAEDEADRFEERFWSGADLAKLYAGAQGRGRDSGGLEAIFESGFRDFNRIGERRGVDSRVQLEGAQRAMRVTTSRELDGQIGRAHVWTPVTKAHLVCRLLLEKKKNTTNDRHDRLARLHHHDTKESQTIEQYNTLTHTCITLYLVHQFSSSALINISLTTTNYITHMCSTHRHRHAIHPI